MKPVHYISEISVVVNLTKRGEKLIHYDESTSYSSPAPMTSDREQPSLTPVPIWLPQVSVESWNSAFVMLSKATEHGTAQTGSSGGYPTRGEMPAGRLPNAFPTRSVVNMPSTQRIAR
ncbi:hypothetical protein WG66_001749 [Moniliophthora roreri]|nr:hypothetical protein WG66_001749 [Moniliophthora roreri]